MRKHLIEANFKDGAHLKGGPHHLQFAHSGMNELQFYKLLKFITNFNEIYSSWEIGNINLDYPLLSMEGWQT